MKKLLYFFISLNLMCLAFLVSAQTVTQQWSSFTVTGAPVLVTFGTSTKFIGTVKAAGTYKCDASVFPSDPAPTEWKACTVYPIKTADTCAPKWAGGTGTGGKFGGSMGLEATGWVSYWCPGPVPVILACKGLAACTAGVSSLLEGTKTFAETASANTTALVTSDDLLPVWSGSANRIASGRP